MSQPFKKLITHFVIQTIFPVHPIGIVVIHPVNYHKVNLSRKNFRKTFYPGKHWCDHDVSPYPSPMQFVKRSNPIHYCGSIWFE